MKTLITGANGQLGLSLRRLLKFAPDIETVFTDIDTLDLTNASAVDKILNEGNFDYLVNCAAYTAVDRAESDVQLCELINTDAVGNIATAAKRTGTKIIHISTDYVFNGENRRPYKENDVPEPKSVYGRTKLAGEALLRSYCPSSIIVRTAWLYSEYGSNFVKTMLRLGKEKEELGVVCDQIGTPTYAHDLAETIIKIMQAEKWVPGIYHFTNEGVTSWFDFTKAIHRIAGISSCKVKPILSKDFPAAAHRPAYSVLDKSKIKKNYNLEIPHWEESLAICIQNIFTNNNT